MNVVTVGARVVTSDTLTLRSVYRNQAGTVVLVDKNRPYCAVTFDDESLNSSRGSVGIPTETLVLETYIINELELL